MIAEVLNCCELSIKCDMKRQSPIPWNPKEQAKVGQLEIKLTQTKKEERKRRRMRYKI